MSYEKKILIALALFGLLAGCAPEERVCTKLDEPTGPVTSCVQGNIKDGVPYVSISREGTKVLDAQVTFDFFQQGDQYHKIANRVIDGVGEGPTEKNLAPLTPTEASYVVDPTNVTMSVGISVPGQCEGSSLSDTCSLEVADFVLVPIH